jgi:hypothetical protein
MPINPFIKILRGTDIVAMIFEAFYNIYEEGHDIRKARRFDRL